MRFIEKENEINIYDCILGQLAMDILHKQVKPFMLRRLKSDVLNDLPPKILQDYYCDLSSIQCLLYEDFANKTKEQSRFSDGDEQSQNGNSTTGHFFKVIVQYTKMMILFSLLFYCRLGFAIFTKIVQPSLSHFIGRTSKMDSCSK